MNEIIEELEKICLRYNIVLNDGIDDKTLNRIYSKLKINIPCDYIQLIKKHNGIEFDGNIIYGVEQNEIKQKQSIYDIIENNELISENDKLAIGESDNSFFVYNNLKLQYEIIDKYGFDVYETFNSLCDLLKFVFSL